MKRAKMLSIHGGAGVLEPQSSLEAICLYAVEISRCVAFEARRAAQAGQCYAELRRMDPAALARQGMAAPDVPRAIFAAFYAGRG